MTYSGLWRVRDMRYGYCLGCNDWSPLPEFGDGLCFLCATAGAPGDKTPTGYLRNEDEEQLKSVVWPSDKEIEKRLEIYEIFAAAQDHHGGLSLDYTQKTEGFCIGSRPDAVTRAIWTRARPRPEPEDPNRRIAQEARQAAVRERVLKRREHCDLLQSFYRVTLLGEKRSMTLTPLLNGEMSASDSFLKDCLDNGYSSVERTLVRKYAPCTRKRIGRVLP